MITTTDNQRANICTRPIIVDNLSVRSLPDGVIYDHAATGYSRVGSAVVAWRLLGEGTVCGERCYLVNIGGERMWTPMDGMTVEGWCPDGW